MAQQEHLCVAMITAAHGIRGLVRIVPYTADAAGITAYGPLTDETGAKEYRIALKSFAKGHWLAAIDGIDDRDAAAALSGTRLYLDRALLPPPDDEDEYYHADLIGLQVRGQDGAPLGQVAALHDFGAGDVIEVAGPEGNGFYPFTRTVVPTVDLANGFIVLVPPFDIEASNDDGPDTGAGDG